MQSHQENKAQEINLPPVIFGTSGLGNLFVPLPEETKFGIVSECFRLSPAPVVFDSAGKYGAGLALEVLGACLRKLKVSPDQVVISNKLGWLRTPLTSPEPTFEPGVWKDLQYDAVQKISYDGIMECFEQGNELLNGYIPQMVSVHDPDEYLAGATDTRHADALYEDILDAYTALHELRRQGIVKAIGVGAKNWQVVQRIAADVQLDWVMIANSMTIKQHPRALVAFIADLRAKGIQVINSAVFHSGFLTGSDYYDYKKVSEETHPELYEWRKRFYETCKEFGIKPAEAAVQFALRVPGVTGIALNTTDEKRVGQNLALAHVSIPAAFWQAMESRELVRPSLMKGLYKIS